MCRTSGKFLPPNGGFGSVFTQTGDLGSPRRGPFRAGVFAARQRQVTCLSISNYPEIEDAGRDAARLRRAIGRLSRSLRATDAGTGLTPTQLSLLATVARRGELPLAELCRIESLNPTLLSRAVGRLEEAGLLRRRPHPDDRRAVLVDVTAAGRRVHRRIRAERTDVLAAQLRALAEPDRAALLAALPVLERVADALEEQSLPAGGAR